MIFAVVSLFIAGLLVAGAFAAVNGDVKLTRTDTSQKKAYYAAVAGVERYKFQLNSNPNYWLKCPKLEKKAVTGTTDEEYTVKTLAATGHSTCESEKQSTIIETSGSASGTFRIESTGTSGGETRSIVATFKHPGFINYVYFSNYEVEDPTNFKPQPTNCEHYYAYRVEHGLTSECGPIQFAAKDEVNGPMHTNDAADVCAEGSLAPTFGRTKADKIEMNGGHYSGGGGCSNTINLLGTYTESGPTLLPPETDSELLEAAGYKFSGKTKIVLKSGTPNTLTVNGGTPKNFPENGVIYVENASAGCSVTYSPFNTDYEHDTNCGNVYVSGTYTESLTIAAANDVIIDGSITTTNEASTGKPTGSATLGLIATNFVRVYHPVKKGYNLPVQALKNPLQEPVKSKCIKEVLTTKGKPKSSLKEVTGLTTSATEKLAVGDEVEGTGIPSGDTIEKINTNKTSIVLKKEATSGNGSTEVSLTFYRATGYEYYSGVNKCVEKAPSGYTYHETEELFVEGSCESGTTYISKGFCEYENTSSKCSTKATNLTENPDPYGFEGSLSSPTIDAAILSTKHSFIVDNYKCGAQLGKLNIWGSVAQFWRGPVGTGGGTGTGYIKNYNYDERLETQQPPSFLSPSSTTWKLSRETAPPNGFTG